MTFSRGGGLRGETAREDKEKSKEAKNKVREQISLFRVNNGAVGIRRA